MYSLSIMTVVFSMHLIHYVFIIFLISPIWITFLCEFVFRWISLLSLVEICNFSCVIITNFLTSILHCFSSYLRIIMEKSPLPVKGCKFCHMPGTHGHWAVRVLWRANTYCDTGHPFIMVISEDTWHSHLMLSVWHWSYHYLFQRLRYVAIEKSNNQPTICIFLKGSMKYNLLKTYYRY